MFDRFLKFVVAAFGPGAIASMYAHTTLVDDHLRVGNVAADKTPQDKRVAAFRAFLESHPYAQIKQLHVDYSGGIAVGYETSDWLTGTLTVTYPENSEGNRREAIRLAEHLHTCFDVLPKAALVAATLPQAQQDSLRHYEVALSALTQKVSELGTIAAQQIEHNNRLLSEKYAQLDRDYQQKDTGLRDDWRKRNDALEQEYRTRKESLDAKELQLKREAEESNRRARMVFRRDLMERVQKLIDETMTAAIPKTAEEKRKEVHIACIAGMGFCALVMAVALAMMATKQTVTWQIIWPFSVSAAGFGGLLVFYVKFLYQWFAELAGAQFTNRKLKTDVLRANWIAELYLESKENAQTELPTELLASFTRNLFVDFDWKHRVQHPLDQVLDSVKEKTVEVTPSSIKVQQK